MGVNYYWYEKPPCPECGRDFNRTHIGKSSFGWCFALHIYPPEIKSLGDWMGLFDRPGSYIKDEDGKKVSHAEMLKVITERKRYVPSRSAPKRHEIDGRLCVGHGEGTWDLYIGEFSWKEG